MNLLSFVRKPDPKKVTNYIVNIHVSLSGWRGPFVNEAHFDRISRAYQESKEKIGGFWIVDSEGNVQRGLMHGLHTIELERDVSDFPPLIMPHLSMKNGRVIRLTPGGSFISEELYFGDVPIRTLDGLYSSLPNQDDNTKIHYLVMDLKAHNPDYKFDSISTREKTRLRLLENTYRMKISDQ